MFYLKDLVHKNIKGEEVVEKDKLFFVLERAGFDGVATKEHVKNYSRSFHEFMLANPSYVLPNSFSDLEIGQPGHKVFEAPKVVAPVSDEGIKKGIKKDEK